MPIPKRKEIFIALYKTRYTIYTDQTGKFPHTSSRGNNYQMIIHEIDGNSTWVDPMKNKTQGEIINARRRALLRMKLQGIVPMHQILDNETSQAFKGEIRNTGMTYQLVPPYNHRRNISDRDIQTWKNHFVRILSGAAATLPLHLRCQAFPQAVRPLLLLGQSNVNPNISSYSHVYGHQNYNSEPFMLIGMESLVHDKPHWRRSFA